MWSHVLVDGHRRTYQAKVDRGARPITGRPAVAVLGAIAAAALVSVAGCGGLKAPSSSGTTASTSAAHSGSKSKTTGTTASAGSGAASNASAAATCRTDYQAVASAVTSYQAEVGQYPQSIGALGQWLHGPVSSHYFTITLGPKDNGVVEVATSNHPAAAGDHNCTYAG
ncbi:MAG TPA: hypothetical protein VME20_04530 [Acidimicrobiales bacterium]|nr:hypothetical protein [Acidimicrobiales bacterium]